ncbi:hypothetical protein G9A89_012831 [Geosiphon pyriformis]|nr:hypothetical protein G9A89_012831 [Geosiphon pyriformis]
MVISLAKKKGININSNLKRQEMRSDQAVIIKEILMNTPKDIIIAVIFKFGEIKLIKIQLIRMWQKTVVEFTKLDQAYLAGRKTCVINKSIEAGNRIHCAVVGFDSNNDLESAFCTESIYDGIKLFWARMNLVCCENYIGEFTKESSKFHRLKLLVSKIVRCSYVSLKDEFISLLNLWSSLDDNNALNIRTLLDSDANSNCVHSAFFRVIKLYPISKLAESKRAEEASIRHAINRRMESFEVNKDHTIRSILKCSFCKVVLDYLVVNNELVLESN